MASFARYDKNEGKEPAKEQEQQSETPAFRSYEEARAWTQQQGLKSVAEWDAQVRRGPRPADIPPNPRKVYRGHGWISWADWFGITR